MYFQEQLCGAQDILEEKGTTRLAVTISTLIAVSSNPRSSAVWKCSIYYFWRRIILPKDFEASNKSQSLWSRTKDKTVRTACMGLHTIIAEIPWKHLSKTDLLGMFVEILEDSFNCHHKWNSKTVKLGITTQIWSIMQSKFFWSCRFVTYCFFLLE